MEKIHLIKRIKNKLARQVRQYLVQAKSTRLTISRYITKDSSGINLIGYFSYTSGVAEVGRFFARYLELTKVPFNIVDIPAAGYSKLEEKSLGSYKSRFVTETVYFRNIFFINADQIALQRENLPEMFIGRYNAAVFFWEFNDYFDFPRAFEVINEVIAFTDFIATAVKKAAPANMKVTKFTFPFVKNWEITQSSADVRRNYEIHDKEFVFIFNFDFYSVYERKNPEAIIHAFEKAFVHTDNVRLVFKTVHSEESNADVNKFRKAVKKMQLIDKVNII